METQSIKFLVHGIDTLVCAYYLAPSDKPAINFEQLGEQREILRQSKAKKPALVSIAGVDFLLHPRGTPSGYPLLLENEDFKIECGEFNKPNFYVTFKSQALWRESAWLLHEKFVRWAGSAGFRLYREESLSRVDFCFDYHLPQLDFCEDDFVSRSSKDSQHRENGKVQTFSFGKGDVVCRIYDKVAEIEQQSNKVWFFLIWGMDKEVWRIEWQVRKNILKRFGIHTFQELQIQQGDILRYLANEHDTLRIPNADSNSSRWPLHPLWIDLQSRITALNTLGVYRVIGRPAALEERMQRMAISLYGYCKSIAAIECVKDNKKSLDLQEALDSFIPRLHKLFEPITWQTEVEKRINDIRCGEW